MQDGESESKTSGPMGSACRLWYHLDSNQGHMDFQSIALPPELWYPMEGGKCRQTLWVDRGGNGFGGNFRARLWFSSSVGFPPVTRCSISFDEMIKYLDEREGLGIKLALEFVSVDDFRHDFS